MTKNPPIAIIGGSGFYDLPFLENKKNEKVSTCFGSVNLTFGKFRGKKIVFLNRHSQGHKLPPHKINYRANISALRKIGATSVIAINSCGSINPKMIPGDFVFIDHFVDFTKSRKSTFFEGGKAGVFHVDLSDPYCSGIRKIMADSAKKLGYRHHKKGVLVVTEGPRFETLAEIKMFASHKWDLVGMTGAPEISLAREAGLCYASVSIVTNFAAGISKKSLSAQEVFDLMDKSSDKLNELLKKAIKKISSEDKCQCIKNKSFPF